MKIIFYSPLSARVGRQGGIGYWNIGRIGENCEDEENRKRLAKTKACIEYLSLLDAKSPYI
jgi:hypothetical protein